MDRAIILAAGRGERLVNGKAYPKPLELVNGVPLIVRVLHGLQAAAVEQVTIVVGHLGDVLVQTLRRYPFDLELRFVQNDEVHKPNGTSLLKAKKSVRGPTLLMMSDHLWSPELLQRVRRFPLCDGEAVLGVDFKIADCFDLEDATKVALRGDRIVRIAKDLPRFDALDTGVFRITEAVIDALEQVDGPNGCSLSQGMFELSKLGRMRAVDVEDAIWVDVDTPAALSHAERLLRRYGSTLRAPRTVSGLDAPAAL
jgi:choline kinase